MGDFTSNNFITFKLKYFCLVLFNLKDSCLVLFNLRDNEVVVAVRALGSANLQYFNKKKTSSYKIFQLIG